MTLTLRDDANATSCPATREKTKKCRPVAGGKQRSFFHFCVWIDLVFKNSFYPSALKGCRGIVFTHGVRMGGWAGGGNKFVRATW